MEKVLGETGLIAVWDKIKDRSFPSKEVTKAKFDEMSDEEKKGLVVVTDDNETSSSQYGEVYSDEETTIGMWMGETLYRRIYSFNLPSANTAGTRIVTLPKDIDVKRIYGNIYRSSGYIYVFPFITDDSAFASLYINGSEIRVKIVGLESSSTIFKSPAVAVIEYTKITN